MIGMDANDDGFDLSMHDQVRIETGIKTVAFATLPEARASSEYPFYGPSRSGPLPIQYPPSTDAVGL
jgi:hypothetical protein